MKISASFSRKVGLPGYCSLGAECTVEVSTSATDAGQVAEKIRDAYRLATQAVEDQIAAQLDLHTGAGRELPASAEEGQGDDDDDRFHADRRPETRPDYQRKSGSTARTEPRAGRPAAGGFDPDRPADGRQLLAMLRRTQAEDGFDGLKCLTAWAKAEGHSWKVVEWDYETVDAAVAYLAARKKPTRNGRAARVPF
jgi:hypothetical protein